MPTHGAPNGPPALPTVDSREIQHDDLSTHADMLRAMTEAGKQGKVWKMKLAWDGNAQRYKMRIWLYPNPTPPIGGYFNPSDLF